ncbi:MAG: 4-hydroxythreonine-4-phosphate dehydrogenase PdxA [Gemmatimonadota bacterium]
MGPEVAAAGVREHAGRASFLVFGPAGADVDLGEAEFRQVGAWTPGAGDALAGRLAGDAIRAAVDAALAGQVDALVTAPIDKHALQRGGYAFPGHTELLRHLTASGAVAMMMAAERTRLGGPLRVVLATTHLPLAAVPAAVTRDLLVEQGLLGAAGLRAGWGIAEPRVALCALNPHASDGGLFGTEEADVLAPAVQGLRHAGVDASGPFPADTVFTRALRGEFDAVIAPYHDVGMAAFKTAAFGTGVNVTLGLPFPRTSPDHGTAMDIAGRGVADPTSMNEAIGLAAHLAMRGWG